LLRQRGALVVEPGVGRLTGDDTGPGRLPEAWELAATAGSVLESGIAPRTLQGRRVVVTAGGTREYLDPVRFLGNRSSGKQGYAFAQAARDRGADVVLIAANTGLPDPAAIEVIRVGSALELAAATEAQAADADVVVMAAAVADFRPAQPSDSKLKKTAGVPAVELTANPDVLAGLARDRAGDRPLLIGFAAETGDGAGDAIDHARAKFETKGADIMVANVVGEGVAFEVDTNAATVLVRGGDEVAIESVSKRRLAERVWDLAEKHLPPR
jgi:phosphopantothenoylcysteine decarboxylase/phosphopantothenate--cysteine ligase